MRPIDWGSSIGIGMMIAGLTIGLWLMFGGCANSQQGYGRATTGGSLPCVVTTLADTGTGSLRDCATRGGQHVVFGVRGTIALSKQVRPASNTTIDGKPRFPGDRPVSLTGPLVFWIVGVENVVINDLYFPRDPLAPILCSNPVDPVDVAGCSAPIVISGGAQSVWVNHNAFTGCGDKCLSAWAFPGSVPLLGADLVTVSSNYFAGSYFALLSGADEHTDPSLFPDAQRMSLYQNFFDRIWRRSPRAASRTHIHAWNNVVKAWGRIPCNGDFASDAVAEGQLLLEANWYEASTGGCTNASESGPGWNGMGPGIVKARGNTLLNGAVIVEANSDQVFVPDYPYTFGPNQRYVEHQAGPRGYGAYGRLP